MNRNNLFLIVITLAVLIISALVISGCNKSSSDQHDGHDHSAHADEPDNHDQETDADEHDHNAHTEGDDHDEDTEDHSGHDHEMSDSEDIHDNEDGADISDDPHVGHDHGDKSPNLIELTPEQRDRIGLELAVAGSEVLTEYKTFPGEVIENPDRIAHVVPQAEGIVREIKKNLGDSVKSGEVLAWIESAELGDAKTIYMEKKQQLDLARPDYNRAQKIYKNTQMLLEFLEQEPPLADLDYMLDLDMGENKGKLISAYSEYVFAKNVYDLEKDLFEKEITSRNEYLEAERAFRIAEAELPAVIDEIAFTSERLLLETERAVGIAELAHSTADRTLHLMGLSESDIISLNNGTKLHSKMSYYPIRSPLSGSITEKHLTLGEKINANDDVFTISDVSSVCVKFNVFQKDLHSVKYGQNVVVEVGEKVSHHAGAIDFVSPTVDEQTRTVQARVTLENEDGEIRPGLYVKVTVGSISSNAGIVIPIDAVQVIDGEDLVFVEDGDGFLAVPVTLGVESNGKVVVLAGLKIGQRFVVSGAFELKANIVTSDLDPHAGHGH